MAVLILIFGTASALRTPTDIFPNINIPVISVVFSYTGLPADDMAGRIVTFYERSLPNAVNDIEHIESQSMKLRDYQDLFSADREHQCRAGAGQRHVANRAEADAAGHHTAVDPELQCLERAYSAARAVERPDVGTQIFDPALNFIRPALAPVPGAALPLPFGGKVRQVQADLNQQALHLWRFRQ
jgi:multidrug efflux pump subunit AcrB